MAAQPPGMRIIPRNAEQSSSPGASQTPRKHLDNHSQFYLVMSTLSKLNSD
jgi:hypothetical protein